ncbi:calcium/sodium antiporter [Candidatus Woesearchaeota archaeon]|nr:calcium/sodium antiporter [Candidatus Woesearchaeota archaeon]
MLELILLVLGLLGLLLGSELIIKGALNIAEHYKISHLFIGLTILAIGTDLPELVIAITGSIDKLMGIETSGLIIGDALGSCFGQIGLTLGIIGLFGVCCLTKRELLRDGLMMVGSVALLFLAGYDGELSRFEGIAFILIYLFYFMSLRREEKIYEKIKRAPPMHLLWDAVSLIGGFAILIYSSNIVVENAITLAQSWGIAQSLVGILIVGLGTSLPELAVSLGAIRKGAFRLSVGNLIGSNIFDILFTLGIGSVIAGFNVSRNLLRFDIPFLFVLSIIALLFFRTKMKIAKKEAIILVLIYAVYVVLKLRGM